MDYRLIGKIAKESIRYKSRGVVEVTPIIVEGKKRGGENLMEYYPQTFHWLTLYWPIKADHTKNNTRGLLKKTINYNVE